METVSSKRNRYAVMDLSLLMQTNFMARTSLAFACPIIKARPANCKRLFYPRNPKILLDFCDIRLKAEILHRTNANSQKLPHLRRGGVLPRPRRMHHRNRTTNGDPVQRPVGARACLHWCIWICNIVPRGRGLPLPRVFALLTLCTSSRTGRVLCPTGCRSARRRASAKARRSCLR